MSGFLQGRGALAILGIAAVTVVAGLFAALRWDALTLNPTSPAAMAPAGIAATQAPPAIAPQSQAAAAPSPPFPTQTAPVPAPAGLAEKAPQAPAPAASPTPPLQAPDPAPSRQAALAPAPSAPPPPAASPSPAPVAPSFDLVRVEPTGDSVIAGRGAPGATIEMLRDGQVHTRGVADQSGLFALVPPPLAPGSHEIILQSIAPDGTRQRSKESVTVAVAAGRNAPPLVALAAPDKPTVILSDPERPAPRRAPGQQQASLPPGLQTPQAAPRPNVRIATVEAEEGGRLFISGEAAPGASVRLYLNDTLVAPGGVGADGKVSFAIGRGVRPGDYRVRLDDVDPVSGQVKSRAEVPFNVPPQLAAALAGPAMASAPQPSFPPARGPETAQRNPAPVASIPVIPADPARRPASFLPQVAAALPPIASPSGAPEPRAASAATPPAAGAAGQVASAVPEMRDLPPGTIVIPQLDTTIVSRGDTLWRISRRVYGRGIRYTVIYGANQPQIRNPRLIYPGQVFVLPPGQETRVQ